MSVRAGLIQKLLATTAVTDLVGQAVFPFGGVPPGEELHSLMPAYWAPQDGVRYVTVQRIGDRGEHHHGGRVDQAFTAWQINAWAPHPSVQDAIDTAIRDTLDAFEGSLGAVAGCVVHKSSELDIFAAPEGGAEDADHGTAFTFAVTFPRAAA